MYAKTISAKVAGTEIRCIVRELGEEAWRFAVSRAALFGNVDDLKAMVNNSEGTWASRVYGAGLFVVAAAVSGSGIGPYNLLRRFFPNHEQFPSCSGFDKNVKARAWELVRKITVQELAPKWKHLLY
jgi:hypothetical protein